MVKVVGKIDDLLENFVGIRDQELSTTVFDLAKAAKDAEAFASKLDEQLTDFEFPDDFVLDVRGGGRVVGNTANRNPCLFHPSLPQGL